MAGVSALWALSREEGDSLRRYRVLLRGALEMAGERDPRETAVLLDVVCGLCEGEEETTEESIKDMSNRESNKDMSNRESNKDMSNRESIRDMSNRESNKDMSNKESIRDMSNKESIRDMSNKESIKDMSNKETSKDFSIKDLTNKESIKDLSTKDSSNESSKDPFNNSSSSITPRGDNALDELVILTRKYLGMTSLQSKQLGVLSLQALASHHRGNSRAIKPLFLFALRSTRTLPAGRRFLFDQLTSSLSRHRFPPSVSRLLRDLASSLLDSSLLDLPPTFPPTSSLQPALEFNLDDDRAAVCLPLFPLSRQVSRQRQDVFLFPALLRLVVAAAKTAGNDWLRSVDALVGCPLITAGDVILDELPREEMVAVVWSKIATLLWMQAEIEAFCDVEETAVRFKLCLRLETVNRLSAELAGILPSFVPPFIPVGMDDGTKRGGKSGVFPFPPSHL